ncbi:group I intron-associated PD-(D/E)XK endonuclease [bacterium]|nr:group I intron-associated PD-(D/E)XK endonuclease [bacterium]
MKGRIGELAIRQDLLSQGYNVYLPEVDVTQVDMIVETQSFAIRRVQIKCVTKLRRGTAIEVDTTKYKDTNRVDVVAIYYEPKNIIAYVPYENTHAISLALSTGKNNQTKGRKWFYSYEYFPDFS